MDIMLDLETMGNRSNSAIIAIGAVSFDKSGVKNEFYKQVSLKSSVESGGEIDTSTVLWWLQQSESARSAFIGNEKADDLRVVLLMFSKFCIEENVAGMWGCGAAFDNVILKNAYDSANLTTPWMFWNDKCYRTARDMNPQIEFVRTGTHHNAVDDARTQAEHLIKIINQSK